MINAWCIVRIIEIDKNDQQNTLHVTCHSATLFGQIPLTRIVLIWTVLTCLAGMIAYVIGDNVGMLTGVLCAIVTGVILYVVMIK